MSDEVKFNRPANPDHAISESEQDLLRRLGAIYQRAYNDDHNLEAMRELVQVALSAAEAVERLETKNHADVALVAKAFPFWPVRARGGEGELKRLDERLKRLGVSEALSNKRSPRSEWPDLGNPINRAARCVCQIVRAMWNDNDDGAEKLGPLGRTNQTKWFNLAWKRYRKDCGGHLENDPILGKTFLSMMGRRKPPTVRANQPAGEEETARPIGPWSPAESLKIGRAAMREDDRQRAEKEATKMRKLVPSAATKSLRYQVRRAFFRWYVVEIVGVVTPE